MNWLRSGSALVAICICVSVRFKTLKDHQMNSLISELMAMGWTSFWSNYSSRCALADMSRYVRSGSCSVLCCSCFQKRGRLFRKSPDGLGIKPHLQCDCGLIHMVWLDFFTRRSLTYLRFHTPKQPSTILIDALIILFSKTDAVQIFDRISSFTQSSKI